MTPAMFAARLRVNQQQLRYFAAGICGLMALFIVVHWIRYLFNRATAGSRSNSGVTYPFRLLTRWAVRISQNDVLPLTPARNIRNILVRKVPGFTSSGHTLLFAAYLAVNMAVTFTNVTLVYSSIANRCGW